MLCRLTEYLQGSFGLPAYPCGAAARQTAVQARAARTELKQARAECGKREYARYDRVAA